MAISDSHDYYSFPYIYIYIYRERELDLSYRSVDSESTAINDSHAGLVIA